MQVGVSESRRTLIFSTLCSTVGLVSLVVLLPLMHSYLQAAKSLMLSEVEICKMESKDLWEQIVYLGEKQRDIRQASRYVGIDGKTCCACTQGAQGKRGLPGKDGEPGSDGAGGQDGRRGKPGKYLSAPLSDSYVYQKCPTGSVGASGLPGPKGAIGYGGKRGLQGNKGKPGHTGATGPQGPRGEPGSPGIQGPMGDEGNVLNGASQGPVGHSGPVGPRGYRGGRGYDGKPGAIGAPGIRGEIGSRGGAGLPGPSGPPGPFGAPGKIGSCTHCEGFDKYFGRSQTEILQSQTNHNQFMVNPAEEFYENERNEGKRRVAVQPESQPERETNKDESAELNRLRKSTSRPSLSNRYLWI